jgi:type IV pilus assembly protein PilY1
MTAISNITAGATIPSTSRGWYYDLSAGYRVLSMPVTYNGVVAFSALLPTGTSSDPCNPVGSSEVFATNYSTGASVLNSNTTGFISFAGPVTTLSYLNTGSSNAGSNGSNSSGVQLFAGGPGIPITAIPTTQTSLATRTINWREIPTPD